VSRGRRTGKRACPEPDPLGARTRCEQTLPWPRGTGSSPRGGRTRCGTVGVVPCPLEAAPACLRPASHTTPAASAGASRAVPDGLQPATFAAAVEAPRPPRATRPRPRPRRPRPRRPASARHPGCGRGAVPCVPPRCPATTGQRRAVPCRPAQRRAERAAPARRLPNEPHSCTGSSRGRRGRLPILGPRPRADGLAYEATKGARGP